jgi:hypothetical protein
MRIRNVQIAGLVLLGLVATSTNPANAQRSNLHFVARPAENFGAVYVNGPTPPANYMFFVSEPIVMTLEIGNRGDVDELLVTSRLPLGAAFRLRALRIPPTAGGTLTVGSEAKTVLAGSSVSLPWGSELRVPARQTLEWTAALVSQGPPGVYEFDIAPVFSGSRMPIAPQGTIFRYELRAIASDADRAELALRNVMRAYATENEQGIEAAIQGLLGVYPASSRAFQIRGEVAARSGRRSDAVAAFARAAALIQSGEDWLFVAQAGPSGVRDTLSWLSTQASSVQ